MIEVVIFDMDGLMIDSEPFHFQAFSTVFNQFGLQFSKEENTKYIGMQDIDEAKDMVDKYLLPVTADELVKRKQAQFRRFLTQAIIPQPGLMKLLGKLQERKYKIGIASSSALEEIESVVNGLKINKYIDVYCSAEQVKKGKPAPDVYLLAAKRLGVKPQNCLVLEDAPNGVRAGKAAGMKVFAIPSQYTKEGDFTQADKVLNSLSDVLSLI